VEVLTRRRKLAVIGVDPGKMTGVVLWTPTGMIADEFEQVDVEPYLEGMLKSLDRLDTDCFIGVQRFAILPGTHKKTRQAAASEVVGTVRDLGRKYGVTVDVQSASTAARFDNDTLRRAGLFTPKCGHANDAARHVLVTLLTFRPDEVAKLIKLGTIDT
jgi:hypothetical protein